MADGHRVRRKAGTRALRRSPLGCLMWILLVVAGALALLIGGLLLRRDRDRETEAPETVTIGGQEVEVETEAAPSELEEAHFTRQEDGTILYSGQAKYGIDVSSHQGEIDWAAVAGEGVEFAFLRIGYRGYTAGAINLDQRFEANLAGAREQGIEVGVYFFSQAVTPQEAEEEAEQVLSWLQGKEIQCPVVYDWEHVEDPSARTNGLDSETITACALAFCSRVGEGGYTPMVYCNGMLGYLSYDITQLEGIDLWYAEYQDYPSYAYEVTVWQYTDSGSLAGIQGKVDRNIWFLDAAGGEETGEEP